MCLLFSYEVARIRSRRSRMRTYAATARNGDLTRKPLMRKAWCAH
jgi:hypothetical protein